MTSTPVPSRPQSPSNAPSAANGHAVTELLHAWGAGDAAASDALVELVYDELRRQARRALRREGDGHTLQATALLHEAWLRLDGQRQARVGEPHAVPRRRRPDDAARARGSRAYAARAEARPRRHVSPDGTRFVIVQQRSTR